MENEEWRIVFLYLKKSQKKNFIMHIFNIK